MGNPLVMTALSSLISALVAAVVSAVVMKVRVVRKTSADAKRESEELKKLIVQNTLMTCRMSIYSDKFSIDEKLDAYEVYRDTCHGNHQTKTYMDGLVGIDVDEYLKKHCNR